MEIDGVSILRLQSWIHQTHAMNEWPLAHQHCTSNMHTLRPVKVPLNDEIWQARHRRQFHYLRDQRTHFRARLDNLFNMDQEISFPWGGLRKAESVDFEPIRA